MSIFAVAVISLISACCDENSASNKSSDAGSVPKAGIAGVAREGFPARIIDVHKEGGCNENETTTLFEVIDSQKPPSRFARCGFFGEKGDEIWWYEK